MILRSTVLLSSALFTFPMVARGTSLAPVAPAVPVPDDGVAKSAELRKTFMLRDLDIEMRRSGRVAVPDMRGQGIVGAPSSSQRPEAKVHTVSAGSPEKPLNWHPVRDDFTLNVQYGDAFSAAVGKCRYTVADQLGVSAADVEAGVVTFRWTIEPSGRVRDASMVSESPTNPALMACAQRLVIGKVLLNAVTKPLALEWTYAFRKLTPSTELLP